STAIVRSDPAIPGGSGRTPGTASWGRNTRVNTAAIPVRCRVAAAAPRTALVTIANNPAGYTRDQRSYLQSLARRRGRLPNPQRETTYHDYRNPLQHDCREDRSRLPLQHRQVSPVRPGRIADTPLRA